jgi:hypothetical protein
MSTGVDLLMGHTQDRSFACGVEVAIMSTVVDLLTGQRTHKLCCRRCCLNIRGVEVAIMSTGEIC